MVNHGTSRACLTCKKRKVKCDQSRPGCQRCQKISKPCPGYLDEWDLTFRSENEAVQAKLSNHQPTTTLVSNVDQHAICLFFHDYILESCDRCPGFLNFLPSQYLQATENSLLRIAVFATAYANLAQKTERPDITIKALSHYRKALRSVKTVFAENLETTSDSIMTAVMLLGLYECINTTLSENDNTHHSQGFVVLTDLRLSLLAEGPSLLQTICCQLQRRNLDLRVPPCPVHKRLLGFLDMTQPANQMILIRHHVSKWVAKVNVVILAGHANSPYQDLLTEFVWLEELLYEWDRTASVTLLDYQKMLPNDPLAEPKYDKYPGFWTVGTWNKHRATRIILHQLFLESLPSFQENQLTEIAGIKFSEQQNISQSTIDQMIQNILASVPFSLGEMSTTPKSVGGYFLVWALQTVLRCPFAAQEQHREARSVLERIGHQCGIRCATMFAQNFVGPHQKNFYRPGFLFPSPDSEMTAN